MMSATWTAALVATMRPNGSFGLRRTRRRASIRAAGVLCEATRCSVSSSSRNTLPYLASQMRAACASILPKAGCRSPGEPLMICSISAVAACCCEAWSSSRVRRAISAFWRALAEPRRRAATAPLRRLGVAVLRCCVLALAPALRRRLMPPPRGLKDKASLRAKLAPLEAVKCKGVTCMGECRRRQYGSVPWRTRPRSSISKISAWAKYS